MNSTTMATESHTVGFLAQAQELRDIQYINATSDDGKTVHFSVKASTSGKLKLSGPNIADLLLSCSQIYAEMNETMQNELILRVDSGARLPLEMLRQLLDRPAKSFFIERFSSYGPSGYLDPFILESHEAKPVIRLVNNRFPYLHTLYLGIASLAANKRWPTPNMLPKNLQSAGREGERPMTSAGERGLGKKRWSIKRMFSS